MIFKIVFGSQIHLYDIKQNYSLSDLKIQIKKLFKKVPKSFQIYYQDSDHDTIYMKCDDDIKNLNDSIDGTKKMTKIFIQETKDQQIQEKLSIISQNNISPQLIQSIKNDSSNDESTDQNYNSLVSQNLQKVQNQQKKTNEELIQAQNAVKSQTILLNKQQSLKQTQNKNQFKKNQKTRIWDICNHEQLKGQLQNSIKKNQNSKDQKIFIENHQQILNQVSQKAKIKQIQPQNIANQKEFSQSHNAKCDKCKQYPIIGIRYQCSVCQNYDLCEECELISEHSHPFLKIKYTYQTPLSIKVELDDKYKKGKMEIVKVEQNISKLSLTEKKERINLIASQISEILGLQFKQCIQLVGKNEKYTKQTITSLILEGLQNKNDQKNQKPKGFWQKIWN